MKGCVQLKPRRAIDARSGAVRKSEEEECVRRVSDEWGERIGEEKEREKGKRKRETVERALCCRGNLEVEVSDRESEREERGGTCPGQYVFVCFFKGTWVKYTYK